MDSQIKVRGHRVDLTEVEKAVSRGPGVNEVVVLCYKPGELSQVSLIFDIYYCIIIIIIYYRCLNYNVSSKITFYNYYIKLY